MSDPYDGMPSEVRALATQSYDDLSSVHKAAKWLIEEVGLGNTYKVTWLKQRFPDISQIDRRMRDLRPKGWGLDTNTENPNLAVGEYHFRTVGGLTSTPGVNNRTRRRVFDRDGNRCVVCGVAAGEAYSDGTPGVAVLTIGHWVPKNQGGSVTDENNLRTECARCNHAIQNLSGPTVTAAAVKAGAMALPRGQREALLSWIGTNSRPQTRAEELWYQWRQLPPAAREEIREALAKSV